MSRIHTFSRQITGEEGFTLTEVLTAMVIIGVLAGIAVPSFVGFRERGHQAAAQTLVRDAVSAVETYRVDNNESYAGMTLGALKAIEPSVDVSVHAQSLGAGTYCISATRGGLTFSKTNPGGQIVAGACA